MRSSSSQLIIALILSCTACFGQVLEDPGGAPLDAVAGRTSTGLFEVPAVGSAGFAGPSLGGFGDGALGVTTLGLDSISFSSPIAGPLDLRFDLSSDAESLGLDLGGSFDALRPGFQLSGGWPLLDPTTRPIPSLGAMSRELLDARAAALGGAPRVGPWSGRTELKWDTGSMYLPSAARLTDLTPPSYTPSPSGLTGQIEPGFARPQLGTTYTNTTPDASLAGDEPSTPAPWGVASPEELDQPWTPPGREDISKPADPTLGGLADTERRLESLQRLESRRRQIAEPGAGRELAPPMFAREGDNDATMPVSTTAKYEAAAASFMKRGKFRTSASYYAILQTADPHEPKWYRGEALAMLGAGEFYIVVRKLVHSLEVRPNVADAPGDLNEMFADPTLLDIRRAALETRLETDDDYRLRFLLGYIEHFSGFEEFGRKHLKSAAAAAPAGSAISRFPRLYEISADAR